MSSLVLSKFGFEILLDVVGYAGRFERESAYIPDTIEEAIPFHRLRYGSCQERPDNRYLTKGGGLMF